EKVVTRLMEILDEKTVELPNARSIRRPDLSWGVASYTQDGRTARELVENADTRAYARKRSHSPSCEPGVSMTADSLPTGSCGRSTMPSRSSRSDRCSRSRRTRAC